MENNHGLFIHVREEQITYLHRRRRMQRSANVAVLVFVQIAVVHDVQVLELCIILSLE